uniref:Transposase n=1 Tax=Heligmosomoides polygyrus TaxID=6339 RepID=A0A183GG90_HELPZ
LGDVVVEVGQTADPNRPDNKKWVTSKPKTCGYVEPSHPSTTRPGNKKCANGRLAMTAASEREQRTAGEKAKGIGYGGSSSQPETKRDELS